MRQVDPVLTGPQADYPVVIGEPFTIDGITYTPSDTLNYDEVGYATRDEASATGVTASHRTLPLPSYVEVTELAGGRTILARVERRGPMTNSRLVALSTAALTQLGASEGTPVRVRRVNPPEDHRADLRAGAEAPLRMDTPEGLLTVLRKNLPAIGSTSLSDEGPARGDSVDDIVTVDPDAETPSPRIETEAAPEPADVEPTDSGTSTPPQPEAKTGDWVVQAGAFSAKTTAERIAEEIGGYVEPTGRLWRVRSGPYATRGQAEAALAKVRGAGYRAAQVYSIR